MKRKVCGFDENDTKTYSCRRSLSLLFAMSKSQEAISRQWKSKAFKMAERSDSCSGETLLGNCTREKRLQKNMTKVYYWIGAQKNIGMFSKS